MNAMPDPIVLPESASPGPWISAPRAAASAWSADADGVPRKLVPGGKPRQPVSNPASPPAASVGLVALSQAGTTVAFGTGFLCAPDVFVTARHTFEVAFDAGAVWMAFDARRSPTPPTVIAAHAWHQTLDLDVLILGTRFPSFLQLGAVAAPQAEIIGYGFSYDDNTAHLSTAQGAVSSMGGGALSYVINTEPGDSGAPILVRDPAGSLWVAAVHTTASGPLANSNNGVLLDPATINAIQALAAHARSFIHP